MGRGIDILVQSLDGYSPPGLAGSSSPVLPGVTLEYFRNDYPVFDDENNLSLVLYLTVHGTSFLFPGDMECDGFEHLLATNLRFRQVVRSINVLVASHHGRENGICEDMFDIYGCYPQLVVISDDYKQYDTQETIHMQAFRGDSDALDQRAHDVLFGLGGQLVPYASRVFEEQHHGFGFG